MRCVFLSAHSSSLPEEVFLGFQLPSGLAVPLPHRKCSKAPTEVGVPVDPTAASAPLPAQATLPVFVQWLVTDGLDLVAFSTSALTQYFVFLRAVASTLSRTAEDRDALTSAAELVLSGGSAAPGTDLRGAP